MRIRVAVVLAVSLFFISWDGTAAIYALMWGDTTPLPLAGIMSSLGLLGFVWSYLSAPSGAPRSIDS